LIIDTRVTILMPAFDAEATLAEALRSVQRQTFEGWSCVIVDDGSDDDTARIASAFEQQDRRFRCVRRPHRGLVPTLNDGLDHCDAPFIARMDADALMHKERLGRQLAEFDRRADLDVLGTHVRLFPRAILKGGIRRYEQWLNSIDSPERLRQDAFIECPIAHPTLFGRQPVLREARYRDEGWTEDYDLVLRLLAAGKTLDVLPQRLLSWRDGPNRVSRTSEACSDASFTRCKAAFLASSFLAPHERYILWGYGRTGRTLSAELETRGKHLSQIVDVHAGRIGNRIRGAPVIAPDDLAGLEHLPLVASVAGVTARTQIRAFLDGLGRVETVDYVCAA